MEKTPRILILSTSLLTNRLLSESFFSQLTELSKVIVWSKTKPVFVNDKCQLEPFPVAKNNREWLNLIRRVNDKSWAINVNLVSILSMDSFNKNLSGQSLKNLFIYCLARVVSAVNLHIWTDKIVVKLVGNQKRSKEAFDRLKKLKPDAVVITNPFWLHESSVAIEAKKLGIKIITLVPSWDNITTKSRMTFYSDAYFVWNKKQIAELNKTYPYSLKSPVIEYGATQYECFGNIGLHWSRKEFCRHFGLNPEKKIILYTTGSPNFLKTEYDGVKQFIDRFRGNEIFKQCQLLVRPHPNKDNNELENLNKPEDRIYVQSTENANITTIERSMGENALMEWINTFLHSDVVINLGSTVILDTLAFNKPVININFDPHPDRLYDKFIKEINSTWTHLSEIYQSEDIPQVDSMDDLEKQILNYLKNPNKGLMGRQKLFLNLCGNVKKPLGGDLARNIVDIIEYNEQ